MAEAVSVDPAQRGTLSIADRVIDKMAAEAASSVDGIVRTGSTLEKFVGRKLPKASSTVRGDQARVRVDVAVLWPMPLAQVAADVRSSVSDTVTRLAGLNVSAVDVTVDRVEQVQTHPARRVE